MGEDKPNSGVLGEVTSGVFQSHWRGEVGEGGGREGSMLLSGLDGEQGSVSSGCNGWGGARGAGEGRVSSRNPDLWWPRGSHN